MHRQRRGDIADAGLTIHAADRERSGNGNAQTHRRIERGVERLVVMVDHAFAGNDQGIAIKPNTDIIGLIGGTGDVEHNARLVADRDVEGPDKINQPHFVGVIEL